MRQRLGCPAACGVGALPPFHWYYKSERENKTWKTDCQWLFDENDKLRKLVNQFMPKPEPARLELSADIILEQTTPEEAKRGEIHKRLTKK